MAKNHAFEATLEAVGKLGDQQRISLFVANMFAPWNERARRRFLERLGMYDWTPEVRLAELRERLKADRIKPYIQIPSTRHLMAREIVECGRDIRARRIARIFAPQK